MSFGTYFSLHDVATRLGRSTATVRRLAERGELGKVYRVAGQMMFQESDLVAFLERNVVVFTPMAKDERRARIDRALGRGPFVPGISARSEGELRRKMSVRTSGLNGIEATNG